MNKKYFTGFRWPGLVTMFVVFTIEALSAISLKPVKKKKKTGLREPENIIDNRIINPIIYPMNLIFWEDSLWHIQR